MKNTSLRNSRIRHLAKTVTWRIIATTTTFTLSYLFFRDTPAALEKASGVAAAEFFIKMIVYYLHERAWYKVDLGLVNRRRRKLRESLEEESLQK